jgi:hypothetical protein
MHLERVQTQNPNQLAYRAGPYWVFATVMSVIGLVFLDGTASRLVIDWPQDAWEYAGGIVFCLALIAWGVSQTGSREVVVDRQAGQLSLTTRWFGIRRQRSFDIRDGVEVRCQKVGGVEVADSYLISIGKPDGTTVQIAEVGPAEDGEKIATEIAHYLQLPLVHYVGNVQVASDDVGQGRARGRHEG